MSAANHIMIAYIFDDATLALWTDIVKYDNFLPLLSDAAHYMKESSRRTYNELF
jgi:hypothetical protein